MICLRRTYVIELKLDKLEFFGKSSGKTPEQGMSSQKLKWASDLVYKFQLNCLKERKIKCWTYRHG